MIASSPCWPCWQESCCVASPRTLWPGLAPLEPAYCFLPAAFSCIKLHQAACLCFILAMPQMRVHSCLPFGHPIA